MLRRFFVDFSRKLIGMRWHFSPKAEVKEINIGIFFEYINKDITHEEINDVRAWALAQ